MTSHACETIRFCTREGSGRRFSSLRFNLKGRALSFIARHIVLPERTTSNSRGPGYRNDRCLGSNVAEENGEREGTKCGWKGEENGNRVGSWECIVSYLASRSKLLRGGLSLYVGNWRKRKQHGRQGGNISLSLSLSSCSAKLRSRNLADGQSYVRYPSTERTRCLFVPLWVSQHTHYRSQRGAN